MCVTCFGQTTSETCYPSPLIKQAFKAWFKAAAFLGWSEPRHSHSPHSSVGRVLRTDVQLSISTRAYIWRQITVSNP